MIKNLYCFWTGDNEMSQTRRLCLESMKNSEMNVVLVTPKNISDFIVEPLHEGYKYLSETHKADYLRAYFMHFHGGCYSDIKAINDSWIDSYNLLMSDDSKIAIGYKEVGEWGIAEVEGNPEITQKMKFFVNNQIGVVAFIFKRMTNFTIEWYDALYNQMETNIDKLREFPAKHPRQITNGIFQESSFNYGYPFSWNKILAQIFQPLVFKYADKILKTLPPPLFHNYR